MKSALILKKSLSLLAPLIFFCNILCHSTQLKLNASNAPSIIIEFENTPASRHSLQSNHLRKWALFDIFDPFLFERHILPDGGITYRNDQHTQVAGTILKDLVEELIGQVLAGSRVFEHFTLLHDQTFSKELMAGCLVFKYNKYPFVVKLFIENPHSFVNPLKKGWVPYLFFLIGGGINRHLAGFTRIQNLIHVNHLIANDNHWKNLVSTPRKWFIKPKQSQLLCLKGHNFTPEIIQISFPNIYCIVADEIVSSEHSSKEHKKVIMDLCNYLNYCIDMNGDNFIVERETNKLVIIDTEHYPSLVGLQTQPQSTNNYLSFVIFLIKNSITNIFTRPTNRAGIPFDMIQ